MITSLFIVLIAKDLIYVAALLTLWAWLRLPAAERLGFLVRFALAGILAVALSKGIAHFYYDTRPFVALQRAPLLPHAADNGFPSDHTTLTMLAALVTLPYSRRTGYLLVACSLLIGAARVASLVHSPIDIAGSVAIAAVSAGAVLALPRALNK